MNLRGALPGLFGLRRGRPATLAGRLARRAERAAQVLGLCYLALQTFPHVLFAHSVSTQGITVYSRSVLPAQAVARVDAAAALVRQSELAVPGRTERIFICDSPWMFGLFCPTSGGAFAASIPLSDNVFIASADFTTGVARSASAEHNTRDLSGVIAHEITHGLIRHRLGWWQGVRLPVWAAEGYCDYVACGGSFPDSEGRRLLVAGANDSSPSFQYYQYRQMVRYLIEAEHGSFADVVRRAGEPSAVLAETRAALQRGDLP